MWRTLAAFGYGVLVGVLWELASMGVLLLATLVEHFCGTLVMSIAFLGVAWLVYSIASRADLARPLLSILVFRLTAQLAMTIGTGSVILTSMLHDTPTCVSDRLNSSGWRRPVLRLLGGRLPRRWLRRIVGVEPPYGPPFLRVLVAVACREWLGWMPAVPGLPSIGLEGDITFTAIDRAERHAADWLLGGPERSADAVLGARMLPQQAQMLTGVYTYACRDARHGDFDYLFRYQAFWMRPAAYVVLHAIGSLLIKMFLMHAYAALFMLLAQGNYRDAFCAEAQRRLDRLKRRLWPRPPVRQIQVEAGDLCAFCHEELLLPPPSDADDSPEPTEAPGATAAAGGDDDASPPYVHCRWGCGKAVHKECAANWGRNACVYCSAPMS